MPAFQSCNFVFTINNPSIELKGDDPNEWPGVRYCVFQLEQGEQGTVHWQGYVCFETKKTIAALKVLSPRAHWEVRQGTHEQARVYCTKEEGRLDGPYEFGDPPTKQGKRNDTAQAMEMIKAGSSLSDIMSEIPAAMRFAGGLKFAHTLLTPKLKRTWKTRVIVNWGVAGSGKSFAAHRDAGPDAYFKPPGHKWFDGYESQENVIFDEFRGNWFDLSTLLRILDAYPMRVEYKGGSVEFVARTIWITSNIAPEAWYNVDIIQINALMRRLTEVHHFINAYVPQ